MNNETHHDSTENQIERNAILVGVQLPETEQAPIGMCLDELTGLAETAFYNPLLSITQNMTTPNPKTFLGSGKVDELQKAVKFHNAKTVIFDDRLSPAQNRNLESALKCRVIDRPWLILEIFSDHAQTREAKTQVELARLKYALPRLTKMWGHLSRQRGGIGMKDVGETQIQLDRRLIRDRISKLEKKLSQIDREKQTQRKSRNASFKVALVGYTNAGKSTLIKTLAGVHKPDEGEIIIEGKKTIFDSPKDALDMGIVTRIFKAAELSGAVKSTCDKLIALPSNSLKCFQSLSLRTMVILLKSEVPSTLSQNLGDFVV